MIFLTVLFLIVTSPSGEHIYIARDQIIAITPSIAGDPRAKSQIITGNGSLYVRETPEEISKKVSVGE